jgi:uncharacterized membrane protein
MNKRPEKHNTDKKVFIALLSVAIISVFFIILFSSLFSYLSDLNYYDKEYQKYSIYDRFPKEKALNETKGLIGFFNSRNNLDSSFFDPGEISHLSDVKVLIDNARLFYTICLIIFWCILIYYAFFRKHLFIAFLSRMMLYAGIFSVAVLVLSAIVYFTIGFDIFFLRFHQLFFTGNYSFNPEVSNMKALFPDAFFSDMAASIYLVTLLKSALLAISGFFIQKKYSSK